MLAAVIAYVDVQLFGLLATEIKSSFSLSDTSLGVLQGLALNLSTAAALIPVGLLVDKINRVRLLMCAAGLWSLFTLLTGLSTDFWQMFACRVCVGATEAAVYPPAYSLIADLYAPKRRGLAVSIFIAGALVGASAATSLSGLLIKFIQTAATAHAGALWGLPAWRLAFVAAALPGFVLLVALAVVREPSRQERDVEVGARGSQNSFLRFVIRERALIGRLIGATVLSQLGMTSVFFWIPSVFTRMFGFSAGRAGEWLGLMFGVGSLSGIAIGAALVALFRRRDESSAPLRVLEIGVVLAALEVLVLPFAQSPWFLAAAITALIGSIYVGIGVTPTILMAVAPSDLRGRLISLQTLILWVSTAITPPLVGALSDRVFTGAHGLVLAFSAVAIPCSLLAPLLLWGARGLFDRSRAAAPLAAN